MKKVLLYLSIILTSFQLLSAQPVLINLGTTNVEANTIYTTLEAPWELKYGPNDSLWMTTKNGKVYTIDPNTGTAVKLLDISPIVYQSGEAGMLGMVLHPNFSTNPYVYIAYTYTNGTNKERLSRFTYNGNTLSSEVVLIDNIEASTNHNGSRVLILPDNTLLMTTGDANNPANSQNMASLNGKVLRINLDGTIPANNPFAGSMVYSFGHRNAQGLALHPTNGRVYSTEHGPNDNDEFQIIESGRNYGWPNVRGFCDDDVPGESAFCTANNVKEPLVSWNPIPGGTWAPSDLVWYDHPSIPEFQNSFLVAFLKTEKVRSVRLNTDGSAVTSQADFFVNQWGRLRDITVDRDGNILIATNISPYRIIKIGTRSAAVIPVAITAYTAKCNNQQINISFTTENENNSKHFLLYKSTDGVNFDLYKTIPSTAPNGNFNGKLTYTIPDNNVNNLPVFYKIMSEDKDGKKLDWGIVNPQCNGVRTIISLFPNPAKANCILKIDGANELLNIQINNLLGQSVYKNRSKNNLNLPVSNMSKGIYHITVLNSKNEVVFSNKLVVQ